LHYDFFKVSKINKITIRRYIRKTIYYNNDFIMSTSIEKVTLSLDRNLLEKIAIRAKKNLSQYIRDLVEREAIKNHGEMEISKDILELKGLLKPDQLSTKERVRKRAIENIRNYDR